MARIKRLIVGLGNPGPEYDGSRHNIGFAVVDAVAEKRNVAWTSTVDAGFFERLRQFGRVAQGAHMLGEGRFRSAAFAVLKPLTYMNRSGEAVAAILRRYQLNPEDMLVAVDDINLPVGAIRIRPRGSAGGHNGLEDVAKCLNSENFPRMRIGVGSNFDRGGQARYVLSPFTEEEQPIIEDTVHRARDAALTFVSHGVGVAMNRYNRKAGADG